MPGILYVVATPIGNLEDVTFRALRVLREVSIVAAEDTRRTARLLQHYSIPTPTTSLHEHNEHARVRGLVDRLSRGESIALVSDAGTPVISDPGAKLVAAAHAAGVKVEPVPGPSAVIAALSASGVGTSEFIFVGFPPGRANARKKWLANLAPESRAVVLFEAPHRIREFLRDALETLGNRTLTVARELTKAHEQLVVRPINELLTIDVRPQGEFTIVVHPPSHAPPRVDQAPDAATLLEEFGVLTNNTNATRRDALKTLAAKYKMPMKEIYRAVERARK